MKNLKLFLLTISLFSLSINNSNAQVEAKPNKEAAIAKQIGSSGFADIVEDLLPAVVNISTSQELNMNNTNIGELFDNLPNGSVFDGLKDLLEKQQAQKKETASLGSGFIISKDGFVVTNYHVIEGADEITVILSDGKKNKAKLIGVDKKTDLALLKIDSPADLKFVLFGDSNKSRIGEWVIAVGNPFGLGGSVSAGIISARGRDIASGQLDGFIQTDAAINKGNSGGPLFNIKGEVIGIATAIFTPSGGNVGIGFATPSSTAISVIKQLKEKGEVIRGWLGVSIQDVSKEMADTLNMDNPKGAFVVEIVKGGPAQKAGVIPTDIIIKFDDQEVAAMKDLPRIVAKTPIGKKVKVVVLRQGKTKTLNAEIKKMQDEDLDKSKSKSGNKNIPDKASSYLLGMGLVDLDKKPDTTKTGIMVVDIKSKSEASKKGIEVGDLILSANQTPVKSITELKKIIEETKKSKRDGVFLFVKRENIIKSPDAAKREEYTFGVVLPVENDKKN
jgi:serine protease Do